MSFFLRLIFLITAMTLLVDDFIHLAFIESMEIVYSEKESEKEDNDEKEGEKEDKEDKEDKTEKNKEDKDTNDKKNYLNYVFYLSNDRTKRQIDLQDECYYQSRARELDNPPPEV
jgi:ABC-type Zn2+ transport system substrate-binding protein/surface adhesin